MSKLYEKCLFSFCLWRKEKPSNSALGIGIKILFAKKIAMESPLFGNAIKNKKFFFFNSNFYLNLFLKPYNFCFNFFLSWFTLPIIITCFIILKIKIMDAKEIRLVSKYANMRVT